MNDVKKILDLAVKHGGGAYELPTAGAAQYFRQRAYTYRASLRKAHGETPYDHLYLSVEGTTVAIRESETLGVFRPLGGGVDEALAAFTKDLADE